MDEADMDGEPRAEGLEEELGEEDEAKEQEEEGPGEVTPCLKTGLLLLAHDSSTNL